MSTLALEEQVAIAAAPAAVFDLLLDPEALVSCMPGAVLESVEGERVFLGSVKVKVGTVALGYQGKIELTTVDPAAHRIVALGEGREKGAPGKVKVDLVGEVRADGAGSVLAISAQVKLAGKIVRFGRGMIDAVSKQLFEEFAGALKARVESNAPAEVVPAGEAKPIQGFALLWRSFVSWLRRLVG